MLQDKGFKVALVTDGRMSGASGKVPAAIHLSPEALGGGPLGKLRDGDIVRLSAEPARSTRSSIRRHGMRAISPRLPGAMPARGANCSPSYAPMPAPPNRTVRQCWRIWMRWYEPCRRGRYRDLALAHGANAVAITGGLANWIRDRLAGPLFHDRFRAKGRFARRMADLPIRLASHPEPGLLGAAAAY